MTKLPKISIIIPCWNMEKYIADAIGSVLGQSYPNIEVIVVNDGSIDGSQEVINGYGNRIVSIRVENGGANKARNIGLQHSTGEFIKFLDADDYFWPGAISAQVEHTLKLKEDEFSVGESIRYSDVTTNLRRYPEWSREMLVTQERVGEFMRMPPPIANTLYRKDALSLIGGFDENVLVRQEVDLFFRYVLAKNKPKLLSKPIFVYRQHPSPGRLSARKLSEAYQSDIRFLHRAVKIAGDLDGIEEFGQIRTALALKVWNMGRDMQRHNYKQEAQIMFALAKSCNQQKYIEGKFLYVLLTQVFGPAMAEVMLSYLKIKIGIANR